MKGKHVKNCRLRKICAPHTGNTCLTYGNRKDAAKVAKAPVHTYADALLPAGIGGGTANGVCAYVKGLSADIKNIPCQQ